MLLFLGGKVRKIETNIDQDESGTVPCDIQYHSSKVRVGKINTPTPIRPGEQKNNVVPDTTRGASIAHKPEKRPRPHCCQEPGYSPGTASLQSLL